MGPLTTSSPSYNSRQAKATDCPGEVTGSTPLTRTIGEAVNPVRSASANVAMR